MYHIFNKIIDPISHGRDLQAIDQFLTSGGEFESSNIVDDVKPTSLERWKISVDELERLFNIAGIRGHDVTWRLWDLRRVRAFIIKNIIHSSNCLLSKWK